MKGLFISILIVGLAGGAILSFSAMNHSKGGTMSGNCPITALPASACPPGTLSATTHLLSMYQMFTVGVVSPIVAQVLAVTLLFVLVAYGLQRYFAQTPHLFILSRNFVAKLYRPQAITRWLSLLVNSPSLI